MLSRASNLRAQRAHIHRAARCADNLLFPWLCPAQARYETQTRCSSSGIQATGRRKVKEDSAPRQTNTQRSSIHSNIRSLATAAAAQDPPADFYPPEFIAAVSNQPLREDGHQYKPLDSVKGFDRISPIIIDNSIATPAHRFRTSPVTGIGGEASEIHLTLEVCLKVGKIERASVLIQRLNDVYPAGSSQLRHAHLIYLEALVMAISENKSQEYLRIVENWFNTGLAKAEFGPEATIYRLMVKACLQYDREDKIADRVYFYMSEAQQHNIELEVLDSSLFSDQDLYKITQIFPVGQEYIGDDLAYEEDFRFDHDLQLRDDLLPNETSRKAPDDVSASLDQQAVPDLLEVEQRGLGLSTLKKSLSLFNSTPNAPISEDGTLSQEDIKASAQRRQERIEEDAVNAAIERWRDEAESLSKMGIFSALHTRTLASVMWDWHGALKDRVAADLALLEKSEAKRKKDPEDQVRCAYGPFLRLLTPDKLSAITILTVIQHLNAQANSAKITQLAMQIGRALQDEALADEIKKEANKRVNKKPVDSTGDALATSYQHRMAQLLQKSKGHSNAASMRYTSNRLRRSTQFPETRNRAWSEGIKLKTGIFLLSMLLKTAKMPVIRTNPETQETVEQIQPAFQHVQQYVRGHKVGMLLPNSALLEKLSQEPVHSSLAKHLPMIVEPNHWTDFRSGGFLRTTVPAVRIAEGDTDQRQYAMVAAKRGDMDQIFQSLDVLGRVPWKINRKVFDVLVEAWNSEEGFAKIPALHPKFDYPPEPKMNADPKERRMWAYQVKSIENEKAGLHSVRCFYNFQLEIAKAYINETFYFPHNIDFRGRTYPIPPYLNHIGADHARGILTFANGKELGESGLKWLKIHLANVHGFDKASLQQREDFAMEHLRDIYDSAENPMRGRRWWLEAEDPWQCLAACMELKAALDSPDPAKFSSSLPVHQDGTCNGLQHYAALGGDYEGAKQVNLVPGDKPADLYTAVAQMVQKALKADAENGDEVAKKITGFIGRKVVKRTVMTNVYGVTFVGAALQVRKELEEILDVTEFPKSTQAALSRRIARKVFDALANLFSGAREIQFWLAESANRISQLLTPEQLDQIELQLDGLDESSLAPRKKNAIRKAFDYSDFKSSVIWTTPLQMPVVQPYRTTKARVVKTHLQRVNLQSPRRSDPIHKRKQLQGFPPNFIHSLDATHMHLTALKCSELGITFAAVHDSFWTHAADIEEMNVALRDAFVRIHSDDVVGRLAAEFEQRYKGAFYQARLTVDSKTTKAIKEWRRERKAQTDKKHLDELLLERKRQRLLASDDPELRKQAEAIMTPTRMVLETSGPQGVSNEEILDQLDEGMERPDSHADEDDLHDHTSLGKNIVPTDDKGGPLGPDKDEAISNEKPSELLLDPAKTLTKKQRARKMLKIWMPFTVPPLPKRGDFDVRRVKDSQYFFS